jgi:hypothetical protein
MRRSVMSLIILAMLLSACSGSLNVTATPTDQDRTTATPCSEAVTTEEAPFLGDVRDLARQADLIVEGTVTDTTPSTWAESRRSQDITTDYIVRVDQQIAGQVSDTVRVRRAGGNIGCGSLRNAVAPVLHDGDRLLLMLKQDEPRPGLPPAYRILGEGQGYWQIKHETIGGEASDVAEKFYRSDTGTFGSPSDGEWLEGIVADIRQARVTGTPAPDPTDGIGVQVNVDYGPPGPAGEPVPLYGLIVTGKVVDVLPPQWTTPSGQRPANLLQMVPEPFTIITPVVIELDAAPILNSFGPLVDSRQITIATERGQVGKNSVDFGPEFKMDEHVLVMLSYFREFGGGFGRFLTPRGLAWNLNAKYQIYGDQIYPPNPNGKTQSLSEFEEQIKAALP